MKKICLYFEIHQIVHLKRYRFFDIGTDHYYYDDYENERSITDIAQRSYMPALNAIGDMIAENGKYFRVAFSLSGVGMEQLELYAPEVIEKLQDLNKTGCVEFLAEPYAHGLSALVDPTSFASNIKLQVRKMEETFGQKPKVLRNSSLIYSDDIGSQAAKLGFKGMLTEGAKHVLGWKSPHYVYNCALAPKLKLLLRDNSLSDDICLRFNDSDWEGYPLFADQYIDRIANFPEEEKEVEKIMEAVRGIRTARTDHGVAPSRKAKVIVTSKDANTRKVFEDGTLLFAKLANASEIDVAEDPSSVPEGAISVVLPDAVLYLPLADLVDVAAETERLEKEVKRLQGELARSEKMLSNERFLAKAPQAKIDEEKEKQKNYQAQMEGVEKELAQMKALKA